MVDAADIKGWIEAGLAECRAEVEGDGEHFNAVIVSPAFAGKTMVEQHQMVYAALGGRMGGEIHALSMRTLTPDE
ncbi:MAG: BolA/IbaG family iron-sulfur metabolism protein [Nitrospirota bacterium]|jgi:acid stress-induced BolA-like protein IbaG/YrbA